MIPSCNSVISPGFFLLLTSWLTLIVSVQAEAPSVIDWSKEKLYPKGRKAYFPDPKNNSYPRPILIDTSAPLVNYDYTKEVKFFINTKDNPSKHELIVLKDLNSTDPRVKPDGKWYISVHGLFGSVVDSPLIPQLVKDLHNSGDVNIIHVDWESIADHDYFATPGVGRYVGDVLNAAVGNGALKNEKLHLVGFSLGAHVVGFAGKQSQAVHSWKVPRITGLDPAYPAFENQPASERIDKTDGEFVEIVHTDGGFAGLWNPVGHFDLYINGGYGVQPGCWFKPPGCSHQFAKKTYGRSQSEKLKCGKCNSWGEFNGGNCRPQYDPECLLGPTRKPCPEGIYELSIE